MVLPVRRRIHWGIGLFCFWALASFCFVRKDLWLCSGYNHQSHIPHPSINQHQILPCAPRPPVVSIVPSHIQLYFRWGENLVLENYIPAL